MQRRRNTRRTKGHKNRTDLIASLYATRLRQSRGERPGFRQRGRQQLVAKNFYALYSFIAGGSSLPKARTLSSTFRSQLRIMTQ